MPTPKLYSPCTHCNATGSRPVPTGGGMVPGVGVDTGRRACKFCHNGFCEVGVTEGQLESIIEERDRLLEFVARVAALGIMVSVDATREKTWIERATELEEEAGALVKDKGARVEEYRIRKGLKTAPAPIPPA